MSADQCDRILRLEINAEQDRGQVKSLAETLEELRDGQLDMVTMLGNIKWFLIGIGIFIAVAQFGLVTTIKAFL